MSMMQKELEYVRDDLEVIATKYRDGTFKCKYCGLVDTPERMLNHYWNTHRKDGDSSSNPNDPVNHPSHYTQGGIECIEAIKASMSHEAYCGYLQGNTMKYIWRHPYKGKPVEDLDKAQFYLDRLIRERKQEVKP